MTAVKKRLIGLLTAAAVLILFAPEVRAAGATTIYLSATSLGVGETLNVDISATDSSSLQIKYTSAILNFTSCSVAGYTTDGNTISVSAKDVSLSFTAATAGKANLIVTSDTQTGSSAAITVTESGTAANADEGADAQTDADATETDATAEGTDDAGDAAAEYEAAAAAEESAVVTAMGAETYPADSGSGDYLINGIPHVLSERFTDDEIPAGFERTQVSIHDTTLNELTNGTMTLVYLKPEANTSGSGVFYIYDEAADTVTTLHLVGSMSDYVILLTPTELWNRNLAETAVTLADGNTVNAYQVGGVASEFYYFYGMDENGTVGWNVYDSATGSVSRADVAVLSLTNTTTEQIVEEVNETIAEEQEAESLAERSARAQKLYENRKWILIGIFILLILVVVFINLRSWKKKLEREGDIFGEYDDEDEPEPEPRRARGRGSFRRQEEPEPEDFEDEYIEDEADFEESVQMTEAASQQQIFTQQQAAPQQFFTQQETPLQPIEPEPIQYEQAVSETEAEEDVEPDIEAQMMASLQAVLADEVEQVQREQQVQTGIERAAAGIVQTAGGAKPTEEIEPEIIDFNDL